MEYIKRPWGAYIVMENAPTHKVRKVTVKPGAGISYHSHQFRKETWVIIQGKGLTTIDGVEGTCWYGKVIDVPPGVNHQIQNTYSEDLIFVEVQVGRYFGDDDILRVNDIHNQINYKLNKK